MTSQETLQAVFDAAPDAFIVTDQNGVVTMANNQVSRLFGYEINEIIGKPVEILIPDRHSKVHVEHRKQYHHQPQPREMGSTLELVGKRKDGSEFSVEIRLSPVETIGQQLVFAAIRDVTAKRKEEQKFKALLESAPDAMVITDMTGTIKYVNSQTEKLFEYSREDLLGLKVERLIPHRFHKGHATQRTHYTNHPSVRAMGSVGIELFGMKKNGLEFPVEISLSPIDTGSEQLIASSIRDITGKKEIAAKLIGYNTLLESKNRELEQFAYIASHDLQEPLRTISSFIDLLQKQYHGVFNEEGDLYFNHIKKASERMGSLIKGLLDYSRLDQEKKLSTIDCQRLVNDIVFDLGVYIQETQTTLNIGPMPHVKGYETSLRLLFQNLITNAIKFRKPNVPALISISAKQIDGCWKFFVTDNGIGIEEKYHERIFMIFQRLHSRKEYEGSGIGLAHCKKIIDLHGGEIGVQSKPNEGSTFHFTIKCPLV